jgi:hypothetical protein
LVSDSCLALFHAMTFFVFARQEAEKLPVTFKIKHGHDDNRHKNDEKQCDTSSSA